MEENFRTSGSWVRKVFDNTSKAAKPFFTKLTRVCLSNVTYNLDDWGRIRQLPGNYVTCLRSYAALPPIKELSAPVLTYGSIYWGKDLPPLLCGVTKLELLSTGHQLDSRSWTEFLDDFLSSKPLSTQLSQTLALEMSDVNA